MVTAKLGLSFEGLIEGCQSRPEGAFQTNGTCNLIEWKLQEMKGARDRKGSD